MPMYHVWDAYMLKLHLIYIYIYLKKGEDRKGAPTLLFHVVCDCDVATLKTKISIGF